MVRETPTPESKTELIRRVEALVRHIDAAVDAGRFDDDMARKRRIQRDVDFVRGEFFEPDATAVWLGPDLGRILARLNDSVLTLDGIDLATRTLASELTSAVASDNPADVVASLDDAAERINFDDLRTSIRVSEPPWLADQDAFEAFIEFDPAERTGAVRELTIQALAWTDDSVLSAAGQALASAATIGGAGGGGIGLLVGLFVGGVAPAVTVAAPAGAAIALTLAWFAARHRAVARDVIRETEHDPTTIRRD